MHYDHSYRCCPAKTSERFHYFQRLPAEIRLMIYEFSLPDARVYEVLDAPHAKQKTPPGQGLMFANVHPEPPPALAVVCQESRFFMLEHYKPLTLGRTTKFVDLSRDILLLEPYLLVRRLQRTLHFMSQIPLVRDNLHCLALGTSYGLSTGICHPVLSWRVSKNNMGKLLSALAKFVRLQTLVLVVHQEFQFEFDFRFPAGGLVCPYSNLPIRNSHSPLFVPPTTHPSLYLHPSQVAPMRALMPAPSDLELASHEPGHRTPSLPFPQPRLLSMPPPRGVSTWAYSVPGTSPAHPPTPYASHSPSSVHAHTHTQPQHHLPYSFPQLVHQAYRFKFDIEANINHRPRRPHFNELLYYPLDLDEEKDDWDLANEPVTSGTGEEEWCDPWPTNDDWRRFRRRFQRAINVAVEMNAQALAAEAGSPVGGLDGSGSGYGRELPPRCFPGVGSGAGSSRGREGKSVRRLRAPELKGASLLWRYTRGRYF